MTEEIPDDEQPPSKRMLSWARNSAIYRLEKRMMTEKQLFDAISRKAKEKFEDISPEQIKALADFAVQFAYEIRALDDTAFAESTKRSALRSGKSKRAIAQKLNQKGVSQAVTEQTLEDVDDFQAAVIFARKRRFGPFRRDESVDEKAISREIAAFARNGYSYGLAKRVISLTDEEADLVIESEHINAL